MRRITFFSPRPADLTSRLLLLVMLAVVPAASLHASSLRRTAIVRAVAAARPAIVNIRGQKTVPSEQDQFTYGEETRRVNGMGTGVIIDQRGYIITNHHVVDGVRQINVTLADGTPFVARLIARDPATDLAIIKIPGTSPLPLIKIGTSRDLMEGEEVIAVGNAYGYEHTVTRGIISALHRTVQVSESQNYFDLIQTDASINPGNSGGPLLNIDGEMIGINVAVRVGAQGIGFAIPVDQAIEVAARLLSAQRVGGVWHGVVPDPSRVSSEGIYARTIQQGSSAQRAGMKPGDVIVQIEEMPVEHCLDLERALLGRKPGQQVEVAFRRDGKIMRVPMLLVAAGETSGQTNEAVADLSWDVFGLRLAEISSDEFRRYRSKFNGGLRVLDVRPNSPATRQGIMPGDVLVGMHKWETVSLGNIAYILNEPEVARNEAIKFYILRGKDTLFGHLPVTWVR